MTKLTLALILIFGLLPLGFGQSTSTVTASNIADAGGNKLASGSVCFQPLLPKNSSATSFAPGGGGIVYPRTVCAAVTNGAITPITLASSLFTSPVGVVYQITVTDTNTTESWILGSASVSGATWSLDAFIPGATFTFYPNAPANVSGTLSVTGDITAPKFHGTADFALAADHWANLPNSCPAGMAPTSQDIHGNWLNCVTTSFQPSGNTPGDAALNPTGNQMITVPSGAFQRIGGASSYVQVDPSGNLVSPTVQSSVNGVLNAAQFPGSDISAKVNAAFAACSTCTVYIPAGNYNVTGTINYPVQTDGVASLEIDHGAVLNPTTTAPVIQVKPTGLTAFENVRIHGGSIACIVTSCQGGIGIDIFVGGHVSDMDIRGFTTGYGVVVEGANTLTIDNVLNTRNQIGFLLAPVFLASTNFAPNAIHIINSQMENDGWGIFAQRESFSGPADSQLCLNNSYVNDVIENNTLGGIFDSCAVGLSIEKTYFEGNPHYISLGAQSGTHTGNVSGVKISDNYFTLGTGITNTIEINGAAGSTFVTGNAELGVAQSGSCFVKDGFDSGTMIQMANTTISTNANCGGNPLIIGSLAFPNGITPTSLGLGFNSITVNDFVYGASGKPVTVRPNPAGTGAGNYIMTWVNIDDSGQMASIDQSGNFSNNGVTQSAAFTSTVGATFTPGAGMGVGAVATCTSGYVCDSNSGQITAAPAGTPAAGTFLTVHINSAKSSNLVCVFQEVNGPSLGVYPGGSSTTTALIGTQNAPSVTTYKINYQCRP